MIRNISLDWAYRILAIVSVVTNITCTLLIKTRYGVTQARQLAFDTTLLKKTEYLLILGFGAFSMLGYFVLIFTLANYANVIGLDSSQASMIPALFMLGQAIGRPGIGWLSDEFGRVNITFLMTFMTGVFSLVIWVNAKSFGVLILFALVGGLSAGVFWVNAAPVLVEVMGIENLPSSLSILWLAMVIPSTFSEPIALEIYTGTGSYLGAQLFTGFTFIAASLCMLVLRGRQIGQAGGTTKGLALSCSKDGSPANADRRGRRSYRELCFWMEKTGLPASKGEIEEAATTLRLHRSPDAKPVHKTWYSRFRDDHPELDTTFLKAKEQSRTAYEEAGVEDTKQWFKQLAEVIMMLKIGASEWWNADQVLENPGIPLPFRIQTVSLKVPDLEFKVLDEII
ncbi:hypothetical protein FPRO04_09581 [Fusarium proliferatum]|nr:hypothetical protein FPRO04_09581 [Fusarium proliferatum]